MRRGTGWRRRRTPVVLASLALVLAGCAAGARRAEPPAAASTLAPPDGRWQRDAAGNEYYLERLPKGQGRRQADGSVRNAWGIPLQVEREDDAYFYYKVFRPPPAAATTPPAPREPTAAERARVAATYAVAIPDQPSFVFAPFDAGLPARGQWRQGFAVADLNGDGHADLVHGPPRKRPGPPVVFLGDGAGGWRPWREARFPSQRFDYGDAAAADLDGDGTVDVALGMHLLGMAAFRHDGAGGFTDAGRGLDVPSAGGTAATFSSRAIVVVDWDRDGRADILALGEGPRLVPGRRGATAGANGLVLYRGAADGGWRRYDQGTGSDRIFGSSLAVGDFDADGRPDAATASSALGRTDVVHYGNPAGGWDATPTAEVRPTAYVRAVAAGDVDRDGRDDLVLAYASFELATWRNGIDLLLARPGRSWERRVLAAAETRTGFHAVAVGDLDADGARDVVALDENGGVAVFRGDGRGGFTRERTPPPAHAGRCRGVHVALADLDGDRTDEIVAAFADEASAQGDEAPRCPTGGGLTAWKVSGR